MSRLATHFQRVTLLSYGIAALLGGCATTKTILNLPDITIQAHKGDVESLYETWIVPFRTKDNQYIPHENREQLSATEEAVRSGFMRFCTTSGGAFSSKKERFGDEYRCIADDGSFLGQFTTERFEGNLLQVRFDSPKRVAARDAHRKEFELRRALNGPTGWIVADEGKYRFLRIGDLNERHVIEIRLGYDSNEYVPIEDILSMNFHKKCCDLDVRLKDGRMKILNTIHFTRRTSPDSISLYGIDGLSIVIVDPTSGEPYTRLFPNLNGIQSIEIDQNVTFWKSQPGAVINTKFQAVSPERLDAYTTKLRREANQLYSEATEQGWIKLLPDGRKLTPQLMDHLQHELGRIVLDRNCRGTIVTGLIDLDSLLHCHVASRELKLVIGVGYSIVTDVTPLSAIITLKKIKSDLK